MKTDYAYCQSKTCIHRRGCRRALSNYYDWAIKELLDSNRTSYINHNDCEFSEDEPFHLLDRFRNSDG